MNISILLPYKENFSSSSAGAVSLFVNDIVKNSKYKNSTYVFGSTKHKKPFLKNYINIDHHKNLFQSTSKNYISEFINIEKKINSNIIEIHNRPNYVYYLKNLKKKKFLYFHNDPLTMKGSKTINDRIFLINHIDKILFNSKWSQNRFFIGLQNSDQLKKKTFVCYQSTSAKKINFNAKKKIISFVGKLNSAKGYDLFGKAVIQILNKHQDWKAVVYGDEPREKINFNHKNLKINNYIANDKLLKFLKKVSISVICSRWEEPFGRTSLEAASCGNAVIISNKGGLPETSSSAIVLKELSINSIFNSLDRLISNNKLLAHYQKENYKNFFLTHSYVSKLIDKIRDEFNTVLKINFFNTKILKIMHITNFNERFNGRLHYNTGKRINNGLIRNNFNVLNISDRDLIHSSKSIKDLKGEKILNKKIIENFLNFNPDVVILGHADKVALSTLVQLKDYNKNLKISQWFLDPLSEKGPDHLNNKRRILDKIDLIDATFLTTEPNSLSFKIPNAYYIPNPSDESFEILNNYNQNCSYDVFFAMSHGVHRGVLRKKKTDDREFFINKLIKMNQNLKFDVYGMNGIQPIWANEFIQKISNSYMGINLSRGEPIKFYSSDRIVQLIGNGLLTFIDKKTQLNKFFTNKEIIFYNNISDLSEKLNKYSVDKVSGKKIAKAGKKKYMKCLNSTIVSKFIVEKTFLPNNKSKYLWEK